jgi:CheY-like chemotaxis protein
MGNIAMRTRDVAVEGRHILVVDDDIELVLMYQKLLQAHGYQASVAENGAKALKLIRNEAVDAILCDLDMPELSGDLLYDEVARTFPELLERFIFVTGNAQNPIYESFLKRTQAGVLSKPVSIDRMLKKLKEVLGVDGESPT